MRAPELAIGAHVRERPLQQASDIALVHARRDHAGGAPLRLAFADHVHQRRRGARVAERRDLRERLARIRWIRLEPRDDQILRRHDLLDDEVRLGPI